MRTIKPEFDFNLPPAIGYVHQKRIHTYRLERIQVRHKIDGTPYAKLWWSSLCPRCAKTYEQASGLRCTNLNRRCPACVDPAKRASGKAGAWAAQQRKNDIADLMR